MKLTKEEKQRLKKAILERSEFSLKNNMTIAGEMEALATIAKVLLRRF